MSEINKNDLIELEADKLAEALLELTFKSDIAQDLVERLVSPPEKNVQRFRKKLSGIQRRRGFIGRRESIGVSHELQMILEDLKAGALDPVEGLKHVSAFYKSDCEIFESCDDSDGCIGDVFQYDAKDLFVEFASRINDKAIIVETIMNLLKEDDYGVRGILIDIAGKILPESIIRKMISDFQEMADREDDLFRKRHWLGLIESLARQIGDAKLFEKTRIASWGDVSDSAYLDIARVYLENDDIESAYSSLKKISEIENFRAHERDQLLIDIYRKQGNKEKLIELLYKDFRSSHSETSLEKLLEVLGEDNRNDVISKEIPLIQQNPKIKYSDVRFLISIGKIDEAEEYILDRVDQIDGDLYELLIPFASVMADNKRYLAAILLYRSLLVSILERGYTKAYSYGVDYLKKLDKLSREIPDWEGFNTHENFKNELYQQHGKKRSFWAKYD